MLTLGWTLRVSASTSGVPSRGIGESDYGQQTAKSNGRGAIGAICQSQSGAVSCRIQSTIRDGPADHAGLRPGDLLLHLENAAPGQLTDQIAKTGPGTRASLEF